MKQGILTWNTDTNAYGILDSNKKWLDKNVLCGQHLQVFVDKKWKDTRMEIKWKNRQQCWYLVGLEELELEGLKVRNC